MIGIQYNMVSILDTYDVFVFALPKIFRFPVYVSKKMIEDAAEYYRDIQC